MVRNPPTSGPSNIKLLKRFTAFVANIPHLQSTKSSIRVGSVKYQTMMGFGGAITGAVAFNLEKLPKALEDSLLASYYSKAQGIGYNMLRIPIGGTDFDLAPWAYNEHPINDVALSNFTQLDPRDLLIVKRVKAVKELVERDTGERLKITAAAWGCPKWMRSPNRWGGPCWLRTEYYQTWADYHIRFLELMQEQGIDIWSVSTGNEPMNGIIGWVVTPWMTLGWNAKDVAKYVAENLGPTLKRSRFNRTLILAGDDQRTTFPWYFTEMRKAHPEAFDYISGLAVHSYLDQYMPAQMLSAGQNAFPDKFILNTESSIGDVRYHPRGPLLGSWDRGVEYVILYMQSIKNAVVGWIDWNLMLDERGGPNYVNNTVEAAIIVNGTGAEAYKQPIFYVIGHFSKFIHEHSVRIEAHSDWDLVDTLAFQRPDDSIAVIINNRYIEEIEVSLRDERRGTKVLKLPPESITTVVYRAQQVEP